MSDSPSENVLRSLELNDKTILKALAQMHKLQQETEQRALESQSATETELRHLRVELLELQREVRALSAKLAGQSGASGGESRPVSLVVCCGMIRSGSTLQYQIVSDLIESRGLGRRAGFVESKTFPEFRSRLADANGFVVIKAHEYLPEIEPWLKQQSAHVFYTYRDIRSVATSVMRKWDIPFSNVVCPNGWLDNAVTAEAAWRAPPQALVSRYEDIVQKLPVEISRWATALGLSLTPNEIEELAARYSVPAQQERIRQAQLPAQGTTPGARDNIDAESQLHHNHITDGSVDGWMKALEPEQIREIETRFARWLREHGYHPSTAT